MIDPGTRRPFFAFSQQQEEGHMSLDLTNPATNPLHTAPMAIVGCEFSGAVRRHLREEGINAWSCDLLEAADGSPYHLQRDILEVLDEPWALGVFHPPCTYLSSSGLHWNGRRSGRAEMTEQAVEFARRLMETNIPHTAVENPVGCLSTRVRRPDQIIQPWMFGADAAKATCLWLVNLPPLVPTMYIPPPVCASQRKVRYALGQPDGQWAELLAPVRRQVGAAFGDLPWRCAGDGEAMGQAASAGGGLT